MEDARASHRAPPLPPETRPNVRRVASADEAKHVADDLKKTVSLSGEEFLSVSDHSRSKTDAVNESLISTIVSPPPRDETPQMRQRAAQHVKEQLRPRVEKLREASLAVFDEAADDPGLRFIIVAAALFVIFLLFLLFSQLLG